MQDSQEFNPEAIAERSLKRIKAAQRRDQRTEALRKVRPMACPIGQAREVDRIHRIDNSIRFKIQDQDGPSGSAFLPSPSEAGVLTYEEYVDRDGRTQRRPRSPELVQQEVIRAFFSKAFSDEQLTLEDLAPYRVRVAWRFIRELGRLRAMVAPDESLIESLKGDISNPDPWVIPELWSRPKNPTMAVDLWAECIDIFTLAENLPTDMQFTRFDFDSNTYKNYPGLAYMPPPVPPAMRDSIGGVSEAYLEEEDKGLVLFVELFKAITKRLHVEEGSEKDRDQGRFGLMGMLDPEMIRLAFPSRVQIVAWEQAMIMEALDLLIEGTPLSAHRELQKRYGLVPRECESLLRQANRMAAKLVQGDLEEVRSIMILKVENFAKRSREALDLKSELGALKQISLVRGLTSEREDNFMEEMIGAMKNIAQDRKNQVRQLPPPVNPFMRVVKNTADRPALPAGAGVSASH